MWLLIHVHLPIMYNVPAAQANPELKNEARKGIPGNVVPTQLS